MIIGRSWASAPYNTAFERALYQHWRIRGPKRAPNDLVVFEYVGVLQLQALYTGRLVLCSRHDSRWRASHRHFKLTRMIRFNCRRCSRRGCARAAGFCRQARKRRSLRHPSVAQVTPSPQRLNMQPPHRFTSLQRSSLPVTMHTNSFPTTPPMSRIDRGVSGVSRERAHNAACPEPLHPKAFTVYHVPEYSLQNSLEP